MWLEDCLNLKDSKDSKDSKEYKEYKEYKNKLRGLLLSRHFNMNKYIVMLIKTGESANRYDKYIVDCMKKRAKYAKKGKQKRMEGCTFSAF